MTSNNARRLQESYAHERLVRYCNGARIVVGGEIVYAVRDGVEVDVSDLDREGGPLTDIEIEIDRRLAAASKAAHK